MPPTPDPTQPNFPRDPLPTDDQLGDLEPLEHEPVTVPRPKGDVEASRRFAIEAARLLKDDRCEDIVVLDVSNVSQVADFVIVASGTSDRQMRGSADDLKELARASDFPVFRQSVDTRTTWCVLDCVDVVVHIFEPNTRSHYDLEMLWGDVPHVDWERPGERSRDLAGLRD